MISKLYRVCLLPYLPFLLLTSLHNSLFSGLILSLVPNICFLFLRDPYSVKTLFQINSQSPGTGGISWGGGGPKYNPLQFDCILL